MTDRQLQIEFERRLQTVDLKLAVEQKLSSDTIFSFLNEAIDKFWKTRYSGLNLKREGFEQTLKRVDDLRTLVKNVSLDEVSASKTMQTFALPADYTILLGDKASIVPADGYEDPCWLKDEKGQYIPKTDDTIESSVETVDKQLGNSLSEHILKYSKARPLRVIDNQGITLYNDGKYKVKTYSITYLSAPLKLDSHNIKNINYTALPEHTHMEIVKMAVELYLATKALPNYKEYSNEVSVME